MKNFALIAVIALAGCSVDAEPQNDDALGQGALLSVDYFGDTDVVGFHFDVEAVACTTGGDYTPGTWSENVDLVDGIFPGMIDHIETVLDPDSKHLGSDLFMTLEPGCYEIIAYPASEIDGDDWTASADCSGVTATVTVEAGATTETVLVAQCVGDPLGASDTTVLLNHPPVLDLDIDEKYNYECEAVEVCVTFYDPDDDPMTVEWLYTADAYDFDEGTAEIIGVEGGHRIWEQCATITTLYTDDYEFGVTVYDQGFDPDGTAGVLVNFEDFLTDENGDAVESNATLTFPIYTNWIELPLCYNSTTGLTEWVGDEIERDATCLLKATSAQEYYCETAHELQDELCEGSDTDADGIDDTWTLIESALYPECV